MATATQPTIVWGQLEASRQWNLLSPARKVWVTAYLANGGDSLAATHTAYPTVSDKAARAMASELRKTQEILNALELVRGGITRQVLLAELREQMRASIKGSPQAAKFAEQIVRLQLSAEPADEAK